MSAFVISVLFLGFLDFGSCISLPNWRFSFFFWLCSFSLTFFFFLPSPLSKILSLYIQAFMDVLSLKSTICCALSFLLVFLPSSVSFLIVRCLWTLPPTRLFSYFLRRNWHGISSFSIPHVFYLTDDLGFTVTLDVPFWHFFSVLFEYLHSVWGCICLVGRFL